MSVLIGVVALLAPLWLLLAGGMVGDRISQERTDAMTRRLFGVDSDSDGGAR